MAGLFMTMVVRDEEDILDYNLAYHLSHGVDHIIVTEHRSIDSTPDILAKYSKDELTVIRRSDVIFQQDRWVTQMSLMAHTMGADFVINADADEFFVSDSGLLQQEFLDRSNPVFRVPSYLVRLVDNPDREPSFPEDTHLIHRYFDVHSSKVMYRASPDIRVGFGNHLVYQGSSKDELVSTMALQTHIVHFRVRNKYQLISQAINGGEPAVQGLIGNGYADNWKNWYLIFGSGKIDEEFSSQILVSREEALRMVLKGDARFFNAKQFQVETPT